MPISWGLKASALRYLGIYLLRYLASVKVDGICYD